MNQYEWICVNVWQTCSSAPRPSNPCLVHSGRPPPVWQTSFIIFTIVIVVTIFTIIVTIVTVINVVTIVTVTIRSLGACTPGSRPARATSSLTFSAAQTTQHFRSATKHGDCKLNIHRWRQVMTLINLVNQGSFVSERHLNVQKLFWFSSIGDLVWWRNIQIKSSTGQHLQVILKEKLKMSLIEKMI